LEYLIKTLTISIDAKNIGEKIKKFKNAQKSGETYET